MRNSKTATRDVLRGVGIVVVAGIALTPWPVDAYVGPGAGLSALGSLLALLAAVVVTFIGFLWYPIKRILRKRNASVTQSQAEQNPGSSNLVEERKGDDAR